MSIIGTVYEDVTTDVLGTIGAWQWLVTFLSATTMLPTFFNIHEDIFLSQPTSNYVCIPPENIKVLNSSLCTLETESNSSIKCTQWQIKFMWLIWQKKTWLIFCDNNLKILSTAMICRLGLTFGCIIIGLISDTFGRKRAIMVNVVADTVMRLIITFCNNEGWFKLFIFLKSLFGSGSLFMGILLTCEIASNNWRTRLVLLVAFPRLLSALLSVPIASTAVNLETCSFIATLYGLGLCCSLRWFPESPHWLLFNRKIDIAENILKAAASKNNVKLCRDFKIRPVNQRAYLSLDETMTCLGLASSYNIRLLIISCFTFWALFFFQLSSLYVPVYIDGHTSLAILLIFAFITLIGTLEYLISQRLSKKKLLLINVFITGIFSCSKMLRGHVLDKVRKIILPISMASGIAIYAILLDLTPRLYAINIRGTFFGTCQAFGEIGVILGYLFVMFDVASALTTMVLDIVVMLVLAGLCLVFPDTDQRELPDIMEDMDYFSELSKPLRWATHKIDGMSLEEIELRVYSFGSSAREPSDRLPAQPIGVSQLRQFMRRIREFCIRLRRNK